MVQRLRIVILVENTVFKSGLIAEHGIAYWIETDNVRILFDTGQGHALPHNITSLKIPIDKTDAVILSHGHYDHSGALEYAMQAADSSTVYVHPHAFHPKYSCRNDTYRFVGYPNKLDCLQKNERFIWTEHTTAIHNTIFVTGEIPRQSSFEDVGGPFFNDPFGHEPDRLMDDQAVYFLTQEGIVVLLGCAHAGVVNTLDFIFNQTGKKRFHAVIGGMHLCNANDDRLRKTIQALKEYEFDIIAPAHCTGEKAKSQLKQEFPGQFTSCSVGTTWEFNVIDIENIHNSIPV